MIVIFVSYSEVNRKRYHIDDIVDKMGAKEAYWISEREAQEKRRKKVDLGLK